MPVTPDAAVPEVTITADVMTGRLLVEDPRSSPEALRESLAGLLGPFMEIGCAAPGSMLSPPIAPSSRSAAGCCVRLAGYWHDSLIEGPGRRSVAKFQGCPIRCGGCITPDSWDPALGVPVPVDLLADALLDPKYQRDGISILGGEPFAQPDALHGLVQALRARGCRHILVYSGYTYERLRRMAEDDSTVGAVLGDIDMLIDGPYVAALAADAGAWKGSSNQRVIDMSATRGCGRVTLASAPGPGA